MTTANETRSIKKESTVGQINQPQILLCNVNGSQFIISSLDLEPEQILLIFIQKLIPVLLEL